MEETTLISNWNHLRKNIAQSQMISVIILAVALFLVATGQLASASNEVKLFALAVVATTGILSLISQFAVIREAAAVTQDLASAKTNTGKLISVSGSYLKLTQFVMVVFAIAVFVLLVLAIY
jgi:lysylphosphatidylglycerol synthetase-like protein (DUF2156 family)